MARTRTEWYGTPSEEFTDQKKYTEAEASQKLGECKKQLMEYYSVEQKFCKGWKSGIHEKPDIWEDMEDTKKTLELYKVWVNEQGEMLLAI